MAGRFRRTRKPGLTRLEDRLAPAATPLGPLQYPYTFTEIMASVRGDTPLSLNDRSDLFDPTRELAILSHDGATLVEFGLRPGVDPMAAVAALQKHPDVAWVTPNHVVYGESRDFTPNDPDYGSQYFHTKMQNHLAWDFTTGDPSIIVAVPDDGVAINHPDLSANIWVNAGEVAGNGIDDDGNGFVDDVRGWDTSSSDNDPNPLDSDSHGTHVAGIAAARSNNAVGVAGTAGGGPNGDGIRIMPVRFYGSGSWTASVIAQSFAYATDNGAKIISTSYNFDGWAPGGVQNATVKAAFDYGYAQGVLFFNSAGNNGALEPARRVFEQALFVANTNSSDTKSSSSNYGKFVDISAPGSSIYATLASSSGTTYSYGNLSGTSMSTPAAAAVAALIWSKNPTWTRDQVAAQLLGTADAIDAVNPTFAGQLGTGRANSFRAVSTTMSAPRLGTVTGLPAEGTSVGVLPPAFSIEVPWRFDPSTVNNANFELVGDGPDNQFGTADDRVLTLTINSGLPYQVGTNTLSFTASGLAPSDRYRFRAISGGLRSPFNVALDGDANGVAGGDFIRTFFVSRAVEGSVFVDQDNDGVRDASEVGAGASWFVFDDVNGNGSFDETKGTFVSPNVPVSITDFTKVTSTQAIAGVSGLLSDVNVRISITHTYTADLDIFLIAPDGTRVELSTDNGSSSNNFTATIFDDTAATSITTGTGPFAGSYRPEGLLASLNGKSANGTWTLEVADDGSNDTGSITDWALILATDVEPSTTTDNDGAFSFGTLSPNGPHTIRVLPRAGFNVTSASTSINVQPGVTSVANLGVAPTDWAFGRVFNDLNGNGTDDNEPALPGVVVYLDGNNNGGFDGGLVTAQSTSTPSPLSDAATTTSGILVTGLVGSIVDVNVGVNLSHPSVADLDIFLVAPDGTRVELSTDNGGSGDNYLNTTFDGQAFATIVAGAAPFTGAYRPEGSLTSLFGKAPNGNWTLEVTDDTAGNVGTLLDWSVTINSGEWAARSDVEGRYRLPGLSTGSTVLRQVLLPGHLSTSPASGAHAYSHGSGASDFGRDFGQYLIPPPAKVSSVVVNGGSIQRSMVNSLTVTFDRAVTFAGAPEAAFTLSRQSGGTVQLASSIDNTGPGTAITLSFVGGEVDLGLPTPSLRDGRYTLSIDSNQVSSAGGALDGDGNGVPGGTFTLVGDPTQGPGLFRLFGDVDADGQVTNTDFLSFRLAFQGTNPHWDFDGSGLVDSADFLEFRIRFLVSV